MSGYLARAESRFGFLGIETDRAGGAVVLYPGDGREIAVAKGESCGFHVVLDAAGYFYWCCDGKRERTRPRWKNVIWIEMQRESEGRKITWSCFSEAPSSVSASIGIAAVQPLEDDMADPDVQATIGTNAQAFALKPIEDDLDDPNSESHEEQFQEHKREPADSTHLPTPPKMSDVEGVASERHQHQLQMSSSERADSLLLSQPDVVDVTAVDPGPSSGSSSLAATKQKSFRSLEVVNGCGHRIAASGDTAPLRKGDPLLKFYEKGGRFGAISWALGDKKTMYCHQVTAGGEFATRVDTDVAKADQTVESVWQQLGKRCCGRYSYDRNSGVLICGELVNEGHDNTCNEETCPFIRAGLSCPTPCWALKP